jgi:hypothetical protein
VALDGALAHGRGDADRLRDADGLGDAQVLVVHDALHALHRRLVGVVDVARRELDLDDLPTLRACMSVPKGAAGGEGTHGVVDVRADDEALGAPVVAVVERDDVARLCNARGEYMRR